MKVFLDTNIWISAFLSNGLCSELVGFCLSRHVILTSPWVLDELSRTLSRKYKSLQLPLASILAFVREETEVVEEASQLTRVARDADDDHILAAAKNGEAGCIISGDLDLLILGSYENIPILTPAQFLQLEPK